MTLVVEERSGTITVTPSALADLVARAAVTVDGAQVRRGRRRLDVDVSNGGTRVRLELTAGCGVVLPELAQTVQAAVANALTGMCRLEVQGVDVSVEEVE